MFTHSTFQHHHIYLHYIDSVTQIQHATAMFTHITLQDSAMFTYTTKCNTAMFTYAMQCDSYVYTHYT